MELLSDEELHSVLGTRPGADANALRAAYLSKIAEHPPERDPEMFERVRNVYQTLSDPKRKMRRYFDAEPLNQPLSDLARKTGSWKGRAFLGTAPWLELLRHMERYRQGGRS